MKINLVHKEIILGEIYPQIASKSTGELKGLLVVTKDYYDYRSLITKYNEIFKSPNSNNLIDSSLDKMLKIKYKELAISYAKLEIQINGRNICNELSRIKIVDNLISTGKGNPVIDIESWNLETNSLEMEFKIYCAEYKYPSEPKNQITIERNGEIILEY